MSQREKLVHTKMTKPPAHGWLRENLLGRATTYGVVSEPTIEAIERFMAEPTERNWDEIAEKYVGTITLWIAVACCYPRRAPRAPYFSLHGKKLSSWTNLPTADMIVQALMEIR